MIRSQRSPYGTQMPREGAVHTIRDDGVAGSGAQLDRLLDPEAGNVTLETLQRAAGVLGRTVRVELV